MKIQHHVGNIDGLFIVQTFFRKEEKAYKQFKVDTPQLHPCFSRDYPFFFLEKSWVSRGTCMVILSFSKALQTLKKIKHAQIFCHHELSVVCCHATSSLVLVMASADSFPNMFDHRYFIPCHISLAYAHETDIQWHY